VYKRQIGGERRYAMRVWLDPLRMAAHGLTTADVEEAIRTANAEIPGGRVEGTQREFSVRTMGELADPEQFADIIVKQQEINPVRLRDVAEVSIGAEDERTVARYNGRPAAGLGVVKQTKASTVDVAHEVRAALPGLKELLPAGMRLDMAYDSAIFIEESITEVNHTLLIAMLLVVLVILLFLKSVRATFIPTLAIPVSILGALAVAYFFGFTLNILTLLALVLAIGLVVDDAIVVLENVYRHQEMGKDRRRASLDGSKEIGFAVVATTISLLAVFVPLAFLQGTVGRLFNEFGISVAMAVFFSGFVALTLTPMLTSKILRPLHGGKQNWMNRSFDAFFHWLDRFYHWTLRTALRWRWAVIASAVVMSSLAVVIFRTLPRELVPTEDRGTAFGIVVAPEGATLD
ncbi:MAG: efflux RND transporter permease subunit, partial [Candidatus Eisenbacteria bacterium]|nr:efflux RND transporter permease subunit [Candidatus Eisenbacteria bacterium]